MAAGSDVRVQAPCVGEPGSAQWAATLINHRQTILPKRLIEPGPDVSQLELIFGAAAAAPDHGELVPWRFVVIPRAERVLLADVFANALQERDPSATAAQLGQAREKAHRAPVLMLAAVDMGLPGCEVPRSERLVSAGCAIQNMLLVATALGFGSALTGGKALNSPGLRTLFSLRDCEEAVCFVSIGTAVARKPPRQRPEASRYISFLPPSCP
jgi:nitroreductase